MDEKARTKFYKNIQSDGERMTRLLDDLRNLAATDMKNTNGVAVVKDAIKFSGSEQSGLDVKYDGPENAILPIPAPDLQVVLTHLFQNALQHGATEMKVSLLDDTLSIKDNGTGISHANIDKIFQPFFTTNRDHGGTGMGLAIVQSTLASHNAQIHAKASENGGHFVILF
jgi:signal transduction histidine kinase